MAVLYKRKGDDVHIYYNRVPKKDGRNPVLGWMMFAVVLVVLRALGLASVAVTYMALPDARDLVAHLVSENLGLFILDVVVLIFLVQYICGKFMRLVFSPTTGKVHRAFLFLRREVAPLDEFREAREDSQEYLGKPQFLFAVFWKKDKVKIPLRISPKVRKRECLSRFHHEIAPLINAMLGAPETASPTRVRRTRPLPAKAKAAPDTTTDDDDAVEAVSVETVEVPVEHAASMLAGGVAAAASAPEEAAPPEKEAGPKGKAAPAARQKGAGKKKGGAAKRYTMYTEKRGMYSPKNNLGYLALFVALFALAVWQIIQPYHSAFFFMGGSMLVGMLYALAKSPVSTRLDPKNATITLWTLFGLRRIDLDIGDLERITRKSVGIGKTLCLVFKDQRLEPVLAETSSDEKLRLALDEFGEIMNLDADQLLDA